MFKTAHHQPTIRHCVAGPTPYPSAEPTRSYSTRLGIARTKCQVYRFTSHLLIEERIPDTAIHAWIIAESKLTQVARSSIQRQHLLQKSLSLPRTRLDRLSLAENQPHSLDCMAFVGSRHIKLDYPNGPLSTGPVKNSPLGKLRLPSLLINTLSSIESLRSVPSPRMCTRFRPISQSTRRCFYAETSFQRAIGSSIIQETDIKHKLLKIVQRHLSILSIGSRRIECRRPSVRFRLLAFASTLAKHF